MTLSKASTTIDGWRTSNADKTTMFDNPEITPIESPIDLKPD
jgi:hypothetical protein